MHDVVCPTLFLHGKKDRLIPHSHSSELMANCSGITYLNLSDMMTHNSFRLYADLIGPLKKFIEKC